MPDELMYQPPNCTGCGAVSSETLAELHRAHAAARDEWQVKLLQAETRARQLAQFVVALNKDFGWDQSDAFQEVGTRLGVVELRRVEPGSSDAENWGEDAELYYLAPWVLELGEADHE